MGPVTVCSLRCHLFAGLPVPLARGRRNGTPQAACDLRLRAAVHHVPVPLPREARGQAVNFQVTPAPAGAGAAQCRCTVPVGPGRLSALPALSCTKRNVAVPSANWDYSKLLVRRLKLASQLALALAQAGSYPTIILNRARTAARGRLLHWDNTGRHWQPLSRTPALAALAVFACTLPTRWKVEARA
jgi:hypothetical protein